MFSNGLSNGTSAYAGNNQVRGYGSYARDHMSGVPQNMMPSATGSARSHLFTDSNQGPVMTFGGESARRLPDSSFREQHGAFRTQGSNNVPQGHPFGTGPGKIVVSIIDRAGVRVTPGLIGEIFTLVEGSNAYPRAEVIVQRKQFNVTPAVIQPDMGTATTFDDSESMFAIGTTRIAKAKQFGTYWALEASSAENLAEIANQMMSAFELTIASMCYDALLAVYTPERCIRELGIRADPTTLTVSPEDFVRMRRDEAALFGVVNKDPNNAATVLLSAADRAMENSSHKATVLMVGESMQHRRAALPIPPVSEIGEDRAKLLRSDTSVIGHDLADRGVKQMFVPRNFIGSNRSPYDAFLKRMALGKYCTTPCMRAIERLGEKYTRGSADPTIIDYHRDAFVTLSHEDAMLNSGLLSGDRAPAYTELALLLVSSVFTDATARGDATIGSWYSQSGCIPTLRNILETRLLANGPDDLGSPFANLGGELGRPNNVVAEIKIDDDASRRLDAFLEKPLAALFTRQCFNWYQKNHIPYPVPLVCGRFGISMSTENIIAIDATTPVGIVFTTGIDSFTSDSINQYGTIQCTSHVGAGVVKPDAIALLPNAFVRAYHGGGNTQFLNNAVTAASQKSTEKGRTFDNHMMVIPVTFAQLAAIQSSRVFTFTLPGFSSDAPMVEIPSYEPGEDVQRPKFMPSRAMCEWFVERYFGDTVYAHPVSHTLGALGREHFIHNLTCTQAYQMSPAVHGLNLAMIERVTPCTHFGQCPHPDVMTRIVRGMSLVS